jgi:hypothetical protein
MAKRKPATETSATRRKVRATRTGYYEHTIRHPGDVFIQDDDISPFSDKWMEKVDDDEPERITGSNAIIQQEHDRILNDRVTGNAAAGDATRGTGDASVID